MTTGGGTHSAKRQKYEHISTACHNKERCGHCGGEHHTEAYTEKEQAQRRRSAVHVVGDHVS